MHAIGSYGSSQFSSVGYRVSRKLGDKHLITELSPAQERCRVFFFVFLRLNKKTSKKQYRKPFDFPVDLMLLDLDNLKTVGNFFNKTIYYSSSWPGIPCVD